MPILAHQGACFQYGVPQGWRVAEDGAFAVVLVAADGCALTAMVGNAGLPEGYPPAQYLFDKLAQGGLEQLRGGPVRPAPPAPGFAFAIELDYAYSVQGSPCLGLARCNVAPGYGMTTMMATWAAADARQWPQYAPWLPALASEIVITSGAAFGARGIAQQNLANSIALGAQARANREWSERQWAAVTQQRGESEDRRNTGFRENLGNVQTWSNPIGYPSIELPNTYAHYWIRRDGQIYGTNDPGEPPTIGLAGDWTPMRRKSDEPPGT